MTELQRIYKERDDLLKIYGYSSYSEYLLSEEWKIIKEKVKNRTKRKWKFCNICGSLNNLDIHHSSYKVIGNLNPSNTIKTLCRDCHDTLHIWSKKYPNNNFYSLHSLIRNWRKKQNLPVFKY